MLAARLMAQVPGRAAFCEAWNFGPDPGSVRPARELVARLIELWGGGSWTDARDAAAPPESAWLSLETGKACGRLGWSPRWSFDEALRRTVDWYRAHASGIGPEETARLTRDQILDFMAADALSARV
jgi:CDP-glucose 4,6-dehydratase